MLVIIHALGFFLQASILSVIAILLYRAAKAVILFTRWLLNGLKKQIVWALLGKISQLTVYPGQKRYRSEFVKTGFSISHYNGCQMDHYRYVPVLDGTYRKMIVRFTNNSRLTISIKEESLLYRKLKLFI